MSTCVSCSSTVTSSGSLRMLSRAADQPGRGRVVAIDEGGSRPWITFDGADGEMEYVVSSLAPTG